MWALRGALLLTGACGPAVTPFVDDATVLELRHPKMGEVPVGNFVGRIPCAICEKIKIVLSLFQNAGDNSPARYQLERTGEDGNARLTTRGVWTHGTGLPGDAPALNVDASCNPCPQHNFVDAAGACQPCLTGFIAHANGCINCGSAGVAPSGVQCKIIVE